MKFRADEEAKSLYEETEEFFTKGLPVNQRESSKAALRDLVEDEGLGPSIERYPSWHPLVWDQSNRGHPSGRPQDCGYAGLDHTRYFLNGFVTCPYPRGGGAAVLESAAAAKPPGAWITARRLGFPLYADIATPILVKCEWHKPLAADGTIPAATAIPLLLLQELQDWEGMQCSETWEAMRGCFLGSPRGARSSLFVNQATGQGIKDVWNTIIRTGAFGS